MMKTMYEFLQQFGGASLDYFWFPLAIWTVIALIAFLVLRVSKNLNPLYQYHLRVATIAAIPFGLFTTLIAQLLRNSLSSSSFDGAIFVVQSPIQLSVNPNLAEPVFNPNWWDPSFLFGSISVVVILVSFVLLARLLYSYVMLKHLHRSISKKPLSKIGETEFQEFSDVKVAFHEHPLVPFTFGWRSPIIVLPKSIQDDPKKVRMAIQHELVHIKRGDYLLQLFLAVIESLLWFHPLVRFGSYEIETYREISCDQEVLNTTGISLKSYASMLYELIPLNRGFGSFSVSMAVQQSTLKKRIVTMKNHKLYESSVKRSLAFLALMIAGVTLPIACSDLRNSDTLSEEELINTYINIPQSTLEINGEEVASNISASREIPLTAGISISTQKHGTFTFSGTRFEGAKKLGLIEGNVVSFSDNELNVRWINSIDFIEGQKAEIWGFHHIENGSRPITIVSFASQAQMISGEYKKAFSNDLATTQTSDFYVVVEQMPVLIGGLKAVQSKMVYPETAKREGIEGRVTVQFIVDKQGNVLEPRILRGIGGGCDEAALEAVSQIKFEPGMQRGEPVNVQYSLPVVFRLQDSEFSDQQEVQTIKTNPDMKMGDLFEELEEARSAIQKKLQINVVSFSNNTFVVKVSDNGNALAGAHIFIPTLKRGTATDPQGIATLSNIDAGNYDIEISFLGYEKALLRHIITD